MDSIERLLSEIKAEYEGKEKPPQPKPQAPLPAEPIRQLSIAAPADVFSKAPDNFALPKEESLIAELRAEYEEKARAEELKRQEAIAEERRRQQQLLQQQQEALNKQARAWLQALDPLSEEGLWFEELAGKYPSRIEAAIDYLQAVGKTKL